VEGSEVDMLVAGMRAHLSEVRLKMAAEQGSPASREGWQQQASPLYTVPDGTDERIKSLEVRLKSVGDKAHGLQGSELVASPARGPSSPGQASPSAMEHSTREAKGGFDRLDTNHDGVLSRGVREWRH